jgi:hypothetical protein
VIGAVGPKAMTAWNGSLPYRSWLAAGCWTYLGFALLASAPWSTWGVSDFRPFAIPPTDKTDFAPLRLFDILALVYLALSSARFRVLAASRWVAGVRACGKHSLEIFSLATLLALSGRLLFITLGTGWDMELAINGLGLGAFLAAARALETTKAKVPLPAVVPALAERPPPSVL